VGKPTLSYPPNISRARDLGNQLIRCLCAGNADTERDEMNAYEVVAQTIIDQLAEGTAPWRKEWVASGYVPKSLSSRKRYNGINHWLLSFSAYAKGYNSPWWGTYKQITELGGNVIKGEKGTPVVLWRQLETEDADGKPKKAVVMRYFTVFNAEQAEWEKGAPKYEAPFSRPDFEIIEGAQRVVGDYFGREGAPKLSYDGDRAFYSPLTDSITLPERTKFTTDHGFYATSFHEIAHSTGHKNRLNREGVVEGHGFGSARYSEEELVAEFTAAFLSAETGILPETLDNSASYVASWYKVLKNDPKLLVKAVARAQKSADYVLNRKATETEGAVE